MTNVTDIDIIRSARMSEINGRMKTRENKYLVVVFDAHTECVDEYRQKYTACEVSMIDETLQVLTENAPLDCRTDAQFQRNCITAATFSPPFTEITVFTRITISDCDGFRWHITVFQKTVLTDQNFQWLLQGVSTAIQSPVRAIFGDLVLGKHPKIGVK